MFGSLMMLASGVLASSPSSASASATCCSGVRRSGNCARIRPASEMSRELDLDAGRGGERLDDRQQRVRRQRRRLVGVGVDDLHDVPFSVLEERRTLATRARPDVPGGRLGPVDACPRPSRGRPRRPEAPQVVPRRPVARVAQRDESWFTSSRGRTARPSARRPGAPPPGSGSCAPRPTWWPTAATARRRSPPSPQRAGVATGTRLPPLPLQGRPARPRSSASPPSARSTRSPRAAALGHRRASARPRRSRRSPRRALRGRRLAWALLAEPVDPAVEAERLPFRRAYADGLRARDPRRRRRRRAARPGRRPDRDRAGRRDRRGARRAAVPRRRRRRRRARRRPHHLLPARHHRPGASDVHHRCGLTPRPSPPTRSATRCRRWRGATCTSTTPPLVEGLEREGGGWAHDRAAEVGAFWGGEPLQWGFAGQRAPAGPAHPRPLRQPPRRGRVPPRLARADGPRRPRRDCTRCRGRTRSRARTSRAPRMLHQRHAGRGRATAARSR